MLTIRQRASNGNRVRPARRGHGHSPAILAAPAEPQHSLVPSGGGSGHSRPGKAGPRGGRRPPHGLLRRVPSQGPSGHTQPTAVSLTLTLGQELASVCLRSPPSRRSLARRRRRAKMPAERTRGARASEPVPARPRGSWPAAGGAQRCGRSARGGLGPRSPSQPGLGAPGPHYRQFVTPDQRSRCFQGHGEGRRA